MKGTEASAADGRWWLPQDVPLDHTLVCEMGPLTLLLRRCRAEWRVAWRYGEEGEGPSTAVLSIEAEPGAANGYERYAFARPDARVTLMPLLADRAVVVRPRHSLFLPGGEETTLYLSSPVYLRLQVGDPPVTLRELPMLRLSDTWFGPNTRVGELCYSGRTGARQTLDEVPRRAHRALTEVRIRNEAAAALPLEKFSLPVPALSVYGTADGALWTQGVSLLRTSHSDMAVMRVDKHPPRGQGKFERIAGPRREHERGALVRAFDVLFGQDY